jgi:hypothetical protein
VSGALILDTGPWVALHCSDERHHAWARALGAVVSAVQKLLER